MRCLVTWVALLSFGLVMAGCANRRANQTGVYAYPPAGTTVEKQSLDTGACQTWAQQQSGYSPGGNTARGAGVGAAIGAVGGAAAGAAIGAVTGGGAGAARGAAIGAAGGGIGGAVSGGVSGYSSSHQGYSRAYAACMSARGYTVQ